MINHTQETNLLAQKGLYLCVKVVLPGPATDDEQFFIGPTRRLNRHGCALLRHQATGEKEMVLRAAGKWVSLTSIPL